MKYLLQFLIVYLVSILQVVKADDHIWIDLIPETDPSKHAIAGNWNKNNEGLNVDASKNARLLLPFSSDGDYDIKVSFTRKTGVHSIALIFTCQGQQAGIELDAWGQHLAGIQLIDGLTIKDNLTRVNGIKLENNRKYMLELQVRGQNIIAKLDGNIITKLNIKDYKLSVLDLWQLPSTNSLAIGAYDSATVFHSIKVKQIAGNKNINTEKPLTNKAITKKLKPDRKDDLSSLNDEFNDIGSIKNWQRVFKTEGTNADQLQTITIDEKNQQLVLVPYTSSWYQDYRGVLVYKRVTGDFIVSTKVQATGRNNLQPPSRQFSLAGIMIRNPRNITPSNWVPGQENYIFLSTGAANQPGTSQFEVKTTVNSDSKLEISPARSTNAEIAAARIGENFVLLKREMNGDWNIHRRYHRNDMSDTLQVGMTVYTDWQNVEKISPEKHNQIAIKNGSPDLEARFEYFRFRRVLVPEELRNSNLSSHNVISNKELIDLLF